MAGKKSKPSTDDRSMGAPLIGLGLGAAGLAILVISGVIFFVARNRQSDPPPLPPPPPIVELNPRPLPPDPPARAEAWWEGMSDSNLKGTVAQLRQVFPQEEALFERMGDKSEDLRLLAYHDLVGKLPVMLRTEKARAPLALLVVDCYALEREERNIAPFRTWFVKQIPQENTEFPVGYTADDLDRSFWAMEASMAALTHKAIKLGRATPLAQDLGKAFGFAIDPSGDRDELKLRAEKLLSLRCYRNLGPTAIKSIANALTIREVLIKKCGKHLSPAFREKMDVEVAFCGLTDAKKCWPEYQTLLRECLKSEDRNTELEMVELYVQADAELAARMEPILATKWKVAADPKLSQTARAKAIQKVLGVPDPADRHTLLEKLARECLDAAKAPQTKNHALLQDTARLAHASTLACALLHKDAGQVKFDQLAARTPEIEPDDVPMATPKEVKPKKDGETKTPADPGKGGVGVPIPAGPRVFNDRLQPGIFTKFHFVALKRGRTYSIDMLSPFDNYLRLDNSKGFRMAEDDDGGSGLNARIIFTSPFDDNYRIHATSFGGRSVGPYSVTVQEIPPFGPPPFGAPFPLPGRPFRPFGKIPPPPPPIVMPGQPIVIPGQPEEKPDQPKQPATPADAPLAEDADLNSLSANTARQRVTALVNITSKLKGDLIQKDFTSAQAAKIAKYLASIIDKSELDDVVPKLKPLAKSRNLMVALADAIEPDKSNQRSSEAVIAILLEQPVQFGKDDWKLACRRLVLHQAVELSGSRKSAAAETAELLRDHYKEQALLLGVSAKDLQPLTRPSQVLENMIKHLMASAAKQTLAKEDKELLDQAPRHMLAAQFVAQDDLEQTIHLQRIWMKVLSIHLQQQTPERAEALRQARTKLTGNETQPTPTALEQLRGGEEAILRLWSVALELK
jgi:hypothetical protein